MISSLTDQNKAGEFGNPDHCLWLEIVGVSGNTCTLRFSTAPGRVYRREFVEDLATVAAWMALPESRKERTVSASA